MKELSYDFIGTGVRNSQDNIWGRRFNSITPNIKKDGAVLKVYLEDQMIEINSFDEIVLTIIMKFTFVPLWLVKQFYGEDVSNVVNDISIVGMENADEKLQKWVDLGLVWKQPSVTGQYLRPTHLLFKLFGEEPKKFTAIPFNMLTHTICEAKVMFDVMSGNSEINKIEQGNLLPRISELGFENDTKGTNIIGEDDFRNPHLYQDYFIKEFNDVENRINRGILDGSAVTPELEDFRHFVLIKKINNTGIIKKDYKFHIADLIIPSLRKEGKPKSIAIEVELTNKKAHNYIETMERYKNNNKFGAVYWLCSDGSTAEALRQAYEEVGGCGSCRVHMLEFKIPTPNF